ncbi:LacI family DNA-binding transcriptional regulator [Allopusillimonas ginsengisoli]|uniref:LacI family DNA-binding transcriptional regulator n=1 Tax=Allopusillimonas ginsengisoli TaxID=453575 RepID=UPI00101FBF10|nr:LacI family DNA-binding transcriptional regulator [Allopusillimonas ginsengisoli]TEA78999.1 LacI family transcriptional regulator [Allopusillimonas ginsengisoli]
MDANDTPGARLPLRGEAGVTIRDVAKALNISHTTVSRALADNPKISEKTKSRVRAMVEQMGYLPSASARMMRGRRSSLVGLIIPDVQNDFYATVAKIVADSLALHSMQLLLSVTDDDPERELRELRAILETRPAGIIIVPTASPRPETCALLQNVETVQLVRVHTDLVGNAVVIDDRGGIRSATRHLIASGHKRLAFVGGDETLSTGRERLGGFQDALNEHRLKATNIALGLPRPEFARYAVTAMMSAKNRPTGIILGSAELTLGALQALRALKLEWPLDVSVVGYHDPPWFELAEEGITTVQLPVKDIATTATTVLLSRLETRHATIPPSASAGTLQFETSLVLRGSTRPL